MSMRYVFPYSTIMPALVGVVMDVSHSMRERNGDVVDWMESIFKTIQKLDDGDRTSEPYIRTCTPEDYVFAIGCGANGEPRVFDILGTVRYAHNMIRDSTPDDLDAVLREGLDILTNHGAPLVRNWADENRLKSLVKLEEAKPNLHFLRTDELFRSEFVQHVLPKECRKRTAKTFTAGGVRTSNVLASHMNAVATCARLIPGVGWKLWIAIKAMSLVAGPVAEHLARKANNKLEGTTDKSIKKNNTERHGSCQEMDSLSS